MSVYDNYDRLDMWKDFFYYSKSERRAVLLLLFLIGAMLALWMGYPYLCTDKVEEEEPSFEKLSLFLNQLDSIDGRRNRYPSSPKKVESVLSRFDPNTADSLSLLRLGLPAFTIRNLLKYRRAGGTFETPDALAKIYGLSKEKFNELRPYIRLEASERKEAAREKSAPLREKPINRPLERQFKYPAGVQVDANAADTAELKKIPGIGSFIARQIVDYRRRLGGFYKVEQLEELKWITPHMLHWLKVEEAPLQKIDINKAGLDRLRNHPYINFYQAKVITEHRKKRGPIKNPAQLSLYEEFTKEDLERLAPYFAFE